MKPRITCITLGVDDLERVLRFYRDGLGLKTDGIVGTEFDHGAVEVDEVMAWEVAWNPRLLLQDRPISRC
jgi:catechol 2,3-dioxygenase-like lactoylglutathione lyase family enzyme